MKNVRSRSWSIGTYPIGYGYFNDGQSMTYDRRQFNALQETVEYPNIDYQARRQLLAMRRKHGRSAIADNVIDWLTNERDLGSEFTTRSITWQPSFARIHVSFRWTSSSYFEADGYVRPDFVQSIPTTNDLLLPSSNDTLFALGGRAISACRPGRPAANLTVALLELRDGIPSIPGALLWKSRASEGMKAASGELLNWEFGLRPLVEDIHKAVQAFLCLDSNWNQYERNAGRHIRRRFHFPQDVVTVKSNGAVAGFPGDPAMPGQFYDRFGTLYKSTVTTTDRWFSGSFRYALPPRDKSQWDRFRYEAQKWNQSYGLGITLDNLWELQPWTWLIDWVVSLGPIISWLSATIDESLVMQYGYLMEHKVESTEWCLKDLYFRGQRQPVTTALKRVKEIKTRKRASPFGFGLVDKDFTPKQWALLAAIGIQRS